MATTATKTTNMKTPLQPQTIDSQLKPIPLSRHYSNKNKIHDKNGNKSYQRITQNDNVCKSVNRLKQFDLRVRHWLPIGKRRFLP
jgi:hypothetical protein